MATFYNFTEGGKVQSFDDIFVPKYPTLGGQVFMTGDNGYGSIGDNTTSNRSTPTQEITYSNNWIDISIGYDSTNAIKSDGTLWGWGDNAQNTVGDNTSTRRSTPRQEFTSSTNWKQLFVDTSVIAIKNDGSLWGWGTGTIGDNTTSNRLTPRQISFSAFNSVYGDGRSGWKQVQTNATAYGAVRTDGTLWMWGRNAYGLLGDGTTATRSTPRQISVGASRINGWKYISTGYHHTSALHSDGTIWSWGRNHVNQLGNNSSVDSLVPVQEFSSSTNWKYLDAGRYNTLAIKEDGTLWVWGYNGFGQLGVNDTAQRPTPTPVWNGLPEWKYIASGDYATAAIKTNGELWTWGSNGPGNTGGNAGYGVLGTNDSVQRNTPVPIVFNGDNKWKSVCMGWGNMIALRYIE